MLAGVLCLYPVTRAAFNLRDPALQRPGIPKVAWRVFRSLTPRYLSWARTSLARPQSATALTTETFSPEWSVLSSVMYLQAAQNLQAAWEAGDHTPGQPPRITARDAIAAAAEVVLDPRNAGWALDQWGTNYLRYRDVFHRALVISALTSREELLRDGAHLDLLRELADLLTRELDSSKTGLLEDFPNMYYPCDVMAALVALRRADGVLHTDHASFLVRAARAFAASNQVRLWVIQRGPAQPGSSGRKETRRESSLPPYQAKSSAGEPGSAVRGCAAAYICLFAPDLWPAEAREWLQAYEEFFWQKRVGAEGFREFRLGSTEHDWMRDSDSGAVVDGYSIAGNVFGLGAARRQGRFDLAYPLAAELLALSWELPGSVLAVPRLVSNLGDAPAFGESALLWQLTVLPAPGFRVRAGGAIPPFAYLLLIAAGIFGAWRFLEAIWVLREVWREPEPEVRCRGLQIALWLLCLAGAVCLILVGRWCLALCLLLAAQLFPRGKKPPVDDWDIKAREAQMEASKPKPQAQTPPGA